MTKIAILDIETTGFPTSECIVEVGFAELNLYTGAIRVIYDELVKEPGLCQKHADSWIFKNSDLDFDSVMRAKPLDKEAIQGILDKYETTAFNKAFDFKFFRSRGFEIRELECPMLLATSVCRIANRRGGGFKWPSVEEAWRFFFPDIPYVEKHRGADDAVHEAKIVHALYKRGVFVPDDEF